MPFMDGFTACKRLKLKAINHEINYLPIVACTAGVDVKNLSDCKIAGFDILHKPI